MRTQSLGDGERSPMPRVRRRTLGDKLLHFVRRSVVSVIAMIVIGWLILVVAVPIMAHGKLVMPADPVVEAVEESAVPQELVDLHRHLLARLAEEGFEEIGWLSIDEMTLGTVTYMGLARHDEERVIGGVVGVVRPSDTGPVLDASFVQLSTDLADGREVATNNSDAPGAFHPRPERRVVSLADVDDPLELYRLHIERLRQFGDGSDVARDPLPAPDELIASVERDLVDELEGQVAEGYFTHDAASRTYRVTWKGAIMMSWKQIWPLSLMM